MKKTIPILIVFLFEIGLSGTAFAGTALNARLQSYSSPKAWVDVITSIDHDKLRMDFKGPSSNGSLIYDRETSQLTLVDHFRKTVLALTSDNQAAIKLLLNIFSGRLKDQADGADAATRRSFYLARDNARAFFNGLPRLKEKSTRVAGFLCDEYDTLLKGKKAREVWVTSPSVAGMDAEDYNTLRSLAHLTVDLCGTLLAQWGADTGPFLQDLMGTELPIQEVIYSKDKPSSLIKVLGIHSQTFTDAAFNPPADYQVLSLLDLIKQGGR